MREHTLPNWLRLLADYYEPKKDVRIGVLLSVYEDEEPSILERATKLYLQDGRFFPTVAEFKPYVEVAQLERHSNYYQENEITHKRPETRVGFSYNSMYEFEVEAGTMPTQDEIQQRIDNAKWRIENEQAAALEAIRAAYERTPVEEAAL